jgi:hypothetical protein
MSTRYALRLATDPHETARVMARYMPANYDVLPVVRETAAGPEHGVLIFGQDNHGWTMDDYVLPRLASGLWYSREITPDEAAEWVGLDPVSAV